MSTAPGTSVPGAVSSVETGSIAGTKGRTTMSADKYDRYAGVKCLITVNVTSTYDITMTPDAVKAAIVANGGTVVEPGDHRFNPEDAADYLYELLLANAGTTVNAVLTSEGEQEGAQVTDVEIEEVQEA